MYYAFTYPYFRYCVTIWGNTYKTSLASLINLQKRAIRIICGKSSYAHTAPLRKKMKIFTLSEIYIYSVELFMFKYQHLLLPNVFSSFFTLNKDVHAHYTRQHNLFHTPLSSSTNLIRIKGVTINNYLRRYVDNGCTLGTYKSRLKLYMQMNDVTFLTT